MKIKKIKFKKAVIGDTVTWVAAIIIIAILLFIYLLITFFMSEKKFILNNFDINLKGEYYGDDFALLESMYSFLNTPVVYENKKMRILDALLSKKISVDDYELYKIVNDTMSFYCSDYFIWVPDVQFLPKGLEPNYYEKGRIYFFRSKDINEKNPWNYGVNYRPNEDVEEVFIRYSTLKSCVGSKDLTK
ncbi:MAG: hypothetical protein QXW97_01900 [Candidatus Pacearchaeota archaeon]